MKPIYVVLSTLAGIAIILLGIKYRKNIIAFFSPKGNLPPSKSDYEKCVESNKAKADGVSCSNCVPDGSGMPNFNGTIVNGICVRVTSQPVSDTKRIQITKEGGTRTFSKDSGGNIVSPQNANMIPKGAVLTVTQSVTSPAPYYNTMYGWIDANDATVVS